MATNLKFYVNAGLTGIESHKPQGESTGIGVIIFDEPSKQIFVNGKAYGFGPDEYNRMESIINVLKATGINLLKESNGVLTVDNTVQKQISDALGDELGDFSSLNLWSPTGAEVTGQTVADYLSNLYTQISSVSSYVTNVSQGAITEINGLTGINGAVTLYGTGITVGGSGYGHETSIAAAINALHTSDNINVGGSGYASGISVASAINALHTSDNILVNGTAYGATSVQAAIDDLAGKYASIDKDSFVNEGTLVYFTADSYSTESDPAVVEGLVGSVEGRHTIDYTADTHYSTTKHDSFNKPYLKLVVAQSTGTSGGQTSTTSNEAYIYISADSLVDVYTVANQSGNPVSLSMTGHEISVNFDIAAATGNYTATGASAGSNVTSTSTIDVISGVSVKTEDGSLSSLTGSSVLADAAGAAAAAKSEVIGATGNAASADTIYGAKAYANSLVDNKFDPTGAAAAVIGATGDNASANTVYGAKAYANSLAGNYDPTGAAASALTAANLYTDNVVSWQVISGTGV